MTVRTIQEKRDSIGYAAVYVENTEASSPRRVPRKKRLRMIAREMDEILDGAQDYLLRHMLDDDLSDEAKSSVFKAAMDSAYLKHYYDSNEHKVVYYPTCKDLVLNHNFIDEAEKYFYREQDKFPSDYRRAISSSVRALERQRLLEEQKRNHHRYEDTDEESESNSVDDLLTMSMHVRLDADMVDKFAGSWKHYDNLDRHDIDHEDDQWEAILVELGLWFFSSCVVLKRTSTSSTTSSSKNKKNQTGKHRK